MVQATWNGQLLAESDATVVVEGNHYFPRAALVEAHLRPSDKTTVCGWKGTANYFDVVVGDAVNEAAAFYYATPKPEAAHIKDHVAFWKGVTVA